MSASKLQNGSDVRIGHSLSTQEEEFVERRVKTVQECLEGHGIHCSPGKVPKIALLGSGGGERAMLGLLGSLDGFNKTGLLDCVLYLSGVSGSTWCMASLYQDSNWSTKLDSVKEKITKRLKGPAMSRNDLCLKLITYYNEKENFSLTDVWAALIITSYMKKIDNSKLSQQRGRNNKDPFPIYTVIDKRSKQHLHERDVFVEISPYEAGYSLTGAFVDNSVFGSQFEEGHIIKYQPEMDMLYLQALCGSCVADEGFNIEYLLEQIKKLFHDVSHEKEVKLGKMSIEGIAPSSIDVGCQILVSLVKMHFSELKGGDHSEHETTIRTKLKELTEDKSWLEAANKTDVKLNVNQFTHEVFECLSDYFPSWVQNIYKCVVKWIWGRNYNFLHKMKGVPSALMKSEMRDYLDAGIVLNSPYMSMLRQERDIDLIISLDFSDGDPFKTVTYASELCEDLNIPFPKVDIPPVKYPKNFYVFEGHGPTVIHIPLFNTVNCGDEVEKWREKYSTFQFPYSPEKIDPLVEVAAKNITNIKQKLLKEIKKIIDRKNN